MPYREFLTSESDADQEEEAPKSRPAAGRAHKKRKLDKDVVEEVVNDEEEEEEEDDNDDGDDDEEDEDDEEEEEEEERYASKKGTRRRNKKRANGFILDEAEVDEDEDDEEIDDADSDFEEHEQEVNRDHQEEEGPSARDIEGQRRRLGGIWEKDEDEALQYLKQKYALKRPQAGEAAIGELEELNEVSLLPTPTDPNMWLVKCRLGSEVETVLLLTRKCLNSGQEFGAMSVILPEGLKGFVYVEAFKEAHVRDLIDGVRALSWGAKQISKVKLEEMTQVLRETKDTLQLKEGQWVRVKKGMYRDDLAEVVAYEQHNRIVHVKLVPRVDYERKRGVLRSAREEETTTLKRKKPSKPQQKPFDPDAVREIGGKVQMEGDYYVFEGNRYRDGFLFKIFQSEEVVSQGVQPSLAELERFKRSIESVKVDTPFEVIELGDNVEVVSGAMAGLHGTAVKKDRDMITVQSKMEGFEEALTFRREELRKYFKIGDHVKVISGSVEGETGVVVRAEDNVVIFISDVNMTEVKVLSKDLKLSSDVAVTNDPTGRFKIGDLVQLDYQSAGVVVDIAREHLKVLDKLGKTKMVRTSAVNKVKNHMRFTATDSCGSAIDQRSTVKVVQGFKKGSDGRVMHMFKGTLFLHSHSHTQNGGYFACRSDNVLVPAAKHIVPGYPLPAQTVSLPMMSPRITPGERNSFNRGWSTGGGRGWERGGRGGWGGRGGFQNGRRGSHLIGKVVRITQGPYKSCTGTVKDAGEETARIQLYSDAKVITVSIQRLSVIDENNPRPSRASVIGSRSGASDRTPSHCYQTPMYGCQTPMYGAKTPVYGAQTPMYGAQTPMHGSQTPMHDGSRTPHVGSAASSNDPGTPRRSIWDPRANDSSPEYVDRRTPASPNPYDD